MEIAFLGSTEMGFKCCKKLIDMGLTIQGILTLPEEFTITYNNKTVKRKNVMYRNFSVFAKQGIDVKFYKGTMKEYLPIFKKWNPKLIFIVGWYHMIPEAIRQTAPYGCVGIHASLLPKYRGGAPLVWAMLNGEKKTGITLFYLEEGVDNGDIIAQKEIIIQKEDTIQTVYEKATEEAIQITEEYIPRILDATNKRFPQNEHEATYYPQRFPEDGEIDWKKSPEEIHNFIRAQTKPYPGAFFVIEGKKITIWDADVEIFKDAIHKK